MVSRQVNAVGCTGGVTEGRAGYGELGDGGRATRGPIDGDDRRGGGGGGGGENRLKGGEDHRWRGASSCRRGRACKRSSVVAVFVNGRSR